MAHSITTIEGAAAPYIIVKLVAEQWGRCRNRVVVNAVRENEARHRLDPMQHPKNRKPPERAARN